MDIKAPVNMSPWKSGAHVAFLQNFAGHTLRGADCGVQNSAGKICSAEFWTPQSAPGGVLDRSKCALWSFGAMHHVPRFLMER